MKITCASAHGGCGKKFELTDTVLKDFRQAVHENRTTGCPNSECDRVIAVPESVALLTSVRLVSEKQAALSQPNAGRWPDFPLTTPMVPDGRRKNGAKPGVCFKKIAEDVQDRPPTPAEILRVQRHFAVGLDDGTDCPTCTRHARRQHRALGCGPARWLIEIVYLSSEGQAIHTGEILKSLKGNNVSGSDATSILPLYGLIVPAEDPEFATNPPPPGSRAKGRTSGFWKPTKLGRAFALDKIKVPERIVTCLGVPEAFEGDPVSIKDALGKKFNYNEIMGRDKS